MREFDARATDVAEEAVQIACSFVKLTLVERFHGAYEAADLFELCMLLLREMIRAQGADNVDLEEYRAILAGIAHHGSNSGVRDRPSTGSVPRTAAFSSEVRAKFREDKAREPEINIPTAFRVAIAYFRHLAAVNDNG